MRNHILPSERLDELAYGRADCAMHVRRCGRLAAGRSDRGPLSAMKNSVTDYGAVNHARSSRVSVLHVRKIAVRI